jgi:hypothetical protein
MQRIVAYFVALVVSVVALVVGIRVVADNTSVLDSVKGGGGAAATTVDIGPPPGPGQFFVRGNVERLVAEGAQQGDIAAPFTLTALERGVGHATIENALVEGRRTSIVWGGGTPLPITGAGGSLDLGGAKVEVDAAGATWTVDGSARALKPGAYRVGAPVAVGVGGLATPRDAVAFTADARTVVSAGGGVVVKVAPGPLEVTGPGKVIATGDLRVRDQSKLAPARGIQFGEGQYTVKVTPVDGRLELDAVLQGTLTRS